mmetsp:Transcript_43523/g.114857  ORF Transcript_43523/g.114857 Transcript_43523/m.114857 type:complete len:324 (+) Transcript_43523:445-1416(+)
MLSRMPSSTSSHAMFNVHQLEADSSTAPAPRAWRWDPIRAPNRSRRSYGVAFTAAPAPPALPPVDQCNAPDTATNWEAVNADRCSSSHAGFTFLCLGRASRSGASWMETISETRDCTRGSTGCSDKNALTSERNSPVLTVRSASNATDTNTVSTSPEGTDQTSNTCTHPSPSFMSARRISSESTRPESRTTITTRRTRKSTSTTNPRMALPAMVPRAAGLTVTRPPAARVAGLECALCTVARPRSEPPFPSSAPSSPRLPSAGLLRGVDDEDTVPPSVPPWDGGRGSCLTLGLALAGDVTCLVPLRFMFGTLPLTASDTMASA